MEVGHIRELFDATNAHGLHSILSLSDYERVDVLSKGFSHKVDFETFK